MTVLIQIPLGFPVSKQLRVPEFILCSLGSGTLYVACEIKDENVVAVPTSLKRSFYFDVLCPVIPVLWRPLCPQVEVGTLMLTAFPHYSSKAQHETAQVTVFIL